MFMIKLYSILILLEYTITIYYEANIFRYCSLPPFYTATIVSIITKKLTSTTFIDITKVYYYYDTSSTASTTTAKPLLPLLHYHYYEGNIFRYFSLPPFHTATIVSIITKKLTSTPYIDITKVYYYYDTSSTASTTTTTSTLSLLRTTTTIADYYYYYYYYYCYYYYCLNLKF